MGSNQSTEISSTVDIFNKNLFNLMISTKNQATQSCVTNQHINTSFRNSTIENCGIDISQQATVSCNLSSMFSDQSSTSLSTLIKTAMDQTADSSNDSTQSFLATALSNQDSNMDLKTYITNIVEKNITMETVNTCISSSELKQDGTFVFDGMKINCGNKGNIEISQNIQLVALADCVTNKITDILSTDTNITDLLQKLSQENTSSQKGISELIDSIAKMLGTVGIIIAVVIVVALLVALWFFLSPAGQKIGEAASKKI